MKVSYILPAIGKRQGKRYVRTWQRMEPLVLAVLQALTPDEIETEMYDDRIELVDFDTATDLVAISVEFYTARRAYQIAERFRARNIPVVLGGYHATLCPDECGRHADAVVTGNAEHVWQSLLEDVRHKRLKPRYDGEHGFTQLVPDRSIYGSRKYSQLATVETGRGCNFSCEFCAITTFYQGTYRHKPVDQIVEEIRSSGKRHIFFADDNIVANQSFAAELCEALIPLNIKWSGQGSLTVGKNLSLLRLMRKSGCELLLVGFESLDPANLQAMGKEWLIKVGERDELTDRIHAAGIHIYATFLFGYDSDTPELLERTLEFAQQKGFYFAAFNHLLPVPGTPLHRRLAEEGKLTNVEWWLDPDYRYGEVVVIPDSMTPQDVCLLCKDARARFFSLRWIFRRSLLLLRRRASIEEILLFWYLNLKLRKEVRTKFGLPLGAGLDELPK